MATRTGLRVRDALKVRRKLKQAEKDAKSFGTHRYIGPTTKWGLVTGVGCLIVGKRAGGVYIRISNGTRWLVGTHEVKRLGAAD